MGKNWLTIDLKVGIIYIAYEGLFYLSHFNKSGKELINCCFKGGRNSERSGESRVGIKNGVGQKYYEIFCFERVLLTLKLFL